MLMEIKMFSSTSICHECGCILELKMLYNSDVSGTVEIDYSLEWLDNCPAHNNNQEAADVLYDKTDLQVMKFIARNRFNFDQIRSFMDKEYIKYHELEELNER